MTDYGTAYPFKSRDAAQTVIDVFGPTVGNERYEIETNGTFYFIAYYDGDTFIGFV